MPPAHRVDPEAGAERHATGLRRERVLLQRHGERPGLAHGRGYHHGADGHARLV